MKTRSKLILLAVAATLLTTLTASAAVYRWKSGFITDPHNFQAARNWNPLRATPLPTDTLCFRTGTRDSVTMVPTQAIRMLIIDSLTQVVMVPDSSGDSLKIGKWLYLELHSSLTISSAMDQMWLYFPSGATASISGVMTLHADSAATCHRIEAVDKGALVFGNGGINGAFIQECNGSVFGTTGQDSVALFNFNEPYVNRRSGNPFGFAAGSNRSKINWTPGSRYVHQSASVTTLSGRRYADFEFDPGTGHTIGDTASGTAAFVCDSLIITTGILSVDHKYPVTIDGDLRVETDAELWLGPTVPINWSFTGSGDQHIKGGGSINPQPKTKLVVNKPFGGLYLMRDIWVADTTHLTKGLIYTGSNIFVNIMSTPVIYYGDSSYIVGNYRTRVPLGNTYLTVPVGTANGVSPLVLSMNSVTTAGKTMTVSAIQGVHPNAPVPSQTLQRYWHIESDLVPALDFSNYGAYFYYRSVDFNTGFIEASDEATMVLGNYNGGVWTSPTIAYHNTSGPGGNINVYGLVTYSDFTMAKSLASFDTTKPRIITRYPANNAPGIQPYDIPYFMFSKPINTSSFAFTINPAVSGLAACWFGSDTVELVHTGDNFQYGTTYTLKITAAYDSVGNPLAVLPDNG